MIAIARSSSSSTSLAAASTRIGAQFKEKGARQDLVSLGVPVGEDQLQHLELARELARRFNQRFGPTFPEPEPILTSTRRLLSLADPRQKMSKSLGPKHHVAIFEAEASIRGKIRAAVTDVGGEGGEASPTVRNLFQILAETAPTVEIQRLERAREEGSLRYSELEEAVTTHLLAALAPLRQRRASLREPDARGMDGGGARARALARATRREVRDRVGILDPSRSR